MKVRVQPGDTVDAGASLLEVLMPEAVDAAGRAEGARVRLEAWEARKQTVTQLKEEGLARTLDVSEAASRVAEARAELQAARAVLVSAGLRERDAASLLQSGGVVALRAPRAGVVTEVSAVQGELREPGTAPLLTLASDATTRVEARFPTPPGEGPFTFLSGGQSVALTLLSRAPGVDPHDGAHVAWFTPATRLSVGALGVVRSDGEGAPGFVVPSDAIHRADARTFVETHHGEVTVTVVQCAASTCVVEGSLTLEDEVSR